MARFVNYSNTDIKKWLTKEVEMRTSLLEHRIVDACEICSKSGLDTILIYDNEDFNLLAKAVKRKPTKSSLGNTTTGLKFKYSFIFKGFDVFTYSYN